METHVRTHIQITEKQLTQSVSIAELKKKKKRIPADAQPNEKKKGNPTTVPCPFHGSSCPIILFI